MQEVSQNSASKTQTALVTGAGGFLGSHIAKQLLEKGYRVKGLARGHYPELESKGIEMIQADLNGPDQYKESLNDVNVIFHTASKVAMWGRRSDFYRTNVQGTERLVKAAKEKNIKYFIYTSTPSVVFEWGNIQNATETMSYAKNSKSRYAHSKIIAEQFVLNQASENFKVTALRPHLIFGPGDQNMIPRLIEAAKEKRLKQVGHGHNKVDVIYVENAAKAHLQVYEALQKGQSNGEAYFIGQGPVELWPFINKILELNRIDPISKKVPFPVAYAIGATIESILQVSGKFNVHPPMSRFVALQLAKDHYFSHDKAQKDFGFYPEVTIDEGLKRTFA